MVREMRPKQIARRCWNFLASRRLSVFLFLGAVALLLLGIFVPQPAPPPLPGGGIAQTELAPSRDSRFLHWVGAARAAALQGVAAALLLNGFVCTVDRAGRVWRTVTRAVPRRLPDEAYERAPSRLGGVHPERLPHLFRGLHNVGSSPEGARFFYGERGRWTPLGTLFTHLGLLFLLAAAIAHGAASSSAHVVLEPGSPTALPTRSKCLLTLTGMAGDSPGEGVRIEVDSGNRLGRLLLTPARSRSACGVRLYVSTYGLAWQVTAASAQGLELPVHYPEAAEWLHFTEGQTAGTFALPAQGITGTVIPSPDALSGRPAEPLRLRLERAGGAVLFDSTVEPSGEREVGGIRLAWQTGVFVQLKAVTDPGFPWLVAGGGSLVLGACLVLWWRPRRVWARWTPDGVLAVRTDRGPLPQ